MNWNTRITELLGCKYPIIEGGLTGLGSKNGDFAAAVSKTGAVGCLTAHSYKDGAKLREALKKLREETDNVFTVNISIGITPNTDELVDVCIDEKVPCIETAAYRPDKYAARIKEAGITWIHKGATVEFVKHAEKLGADAVVLVGLDGYGFKALRQLPTFTGIAYAARVLDVPLIAAGGIGDGRTMLAALMAGAEAVYMGTALMATRECPIADKVKRNIVHAVPDHPELIFELVAPPNPEIYREVIEKKGTMPLNKWLLSLEMVMLKQNQWRDIDPSIYMGGNLLEAAADETGEKHSPKGLFSFACAYVDKIPTVREFIDGMVSEAEGILKEKLDRWGLGQGCP